MIKTKIVILTIISLIYCSLNISCRSDSTSVRSDKIDNSVYKTEIFNNQFKKIYGSWKLQKIETGWGDIKPDFDYLVIKPIGIFTILRNDSILTNGKIEIIEQNEKYLNIRFKANHGININLLRDSEKTIDFTNKNLIWMVAPCCDRANYLLKRQ